jgi:hypothetical protein
VIRPERVRLEPHDATGENRLPGMVERIVYRGNSNHVFIRLPTGEQIQALVQNMGDETPYDTGDPVRMYLPPHALRVLADTDSPRPEGVARRESEQETGTAISG